MNNLPPAAASVFFSRERSCRHCISTALCKPESDTGPSPASRRHVLNKGNHLFRTGDPFGALYVIQSGCIKTSMLTSGGDAQVLKFSLPGETVGINAIGSNHHPCDAVALERTELCEIPFEPLQKLAREYPQVQHHLMCLLSDEIVLDGKLMAMLGRQKADTRMASCLLDFRQRYPQQGNTDLSFRLPMSRQDLGDYLGLSLETISRLLSRFQAEGLLRVQGRLVHVLDLSRLQSIAGHCPPPAAARG